MLGRTCVLQQEHITPEQLGAALSPSRQTDFWKIVRNITSPSASIVDKLSCDVDIANAFSRKLQDRLNCDDDAASLLSLDQF